MQAHYKGQAAQAMVSFTGPGLHFRLAQELERLVTDYQQENWDGHRAAAVNPQSHLAAQLFIQSLPYGMPDPTIDADPDGCVTFEWYASPRKLVFISVHPDYKIDYAMLVGDAKTYGTEPFFGKLPDKIEELVQRICKV